MKKFVQYGAGNIGRGFIGQLFSKAGYEVVFIDVVDAVIEKFNMDRAYPVRFVSRDGWEEETVTGVRAVDGKNTQATAAEIADADVMATAVGVNILPRIVSNITEGLKQRWKKGNLNPLNIIICENKLDADKYLAELIKEGLDSAEKNKFDELVGLVEASIGRMVPVMTPEMAEGNILRVWVERYAKLPVDKKAFKGELPAVPQLVPFSPFEYYIRRKLFVHNMGHALSAYLGKLCGAQLIADAVDIPIIKLIAERAMLSSSAALAKEFEISLSELLLHVDDLLYRFGNRLLGDTVDRVGRDTVRKLSREDRLTGAALLCEKHGICAAYTSLGIAAGFMFAAEGDEASHQVSAFAREKGIDEAIKKYCCVAEENSFYADIKDFYLKLSTGAMLPELLGIAENKTDAYNSR